MPDEKVERKCLGKYTIGEVFEYIDASPHNGQKVKFHGHLIHFRATRILNFKVHGITCVECGARGVFFAKEKNSDEDSPHLNLYAIDKYGHPILMTQDHIKPKAKGGTNHLYNLQPMCARCNCAKSDIWSFKNKVKYLFRLIKRFFDDDYKHN